MYFYVLTQPSGSISMNTPILQLEDWVADNAEGSPNSIYFEAELVVPDDKEHASWCITRGSCNC